MKQILTTILLTLALIPCATLAQGLDPEEEEQVQQTSAMDKLIKGYEVNQRRAVEPEDQASEVRRLKSLLIDVRVERDRLAEEVLFLKATVDNMVEQEGTQSGCIQVECIPVTEVEQDKIITHVIYTISQYRLAELLTQTVPEEYVEVHNTAQRIMTGAKNDLDVLGFDTSNMSDYPSLDEVIEQWNISQGSRAAR